MGYHLAYNPRNPGVPHIVCNHVLALSMIELARVLAGDTELIGEIRQSIRRDDDGSAQQLAEAAFLPLTNVDTAAELESGALRRNAVLAHGRVHGSPSFSRTTAASHSFVRYSMYRNDRRLSPFGFIAGTYATTIADAQMVTCAFAAVGRYALPSIAPPVHVFVDTAPANLALQVGTVAPANGQAGGGTEVLFPTGTGSGRLPSHHMVDEF
ncbi:hypothetical protein [Chthonobacter albigriseus]|uniref:hypothetical protein n=1 Tax=Chthonobacter albigriseus TaxID=1683161 RepID=UPI0015EEA7C8|nr:hypothetical protein [Chthonobacter albigriseus]